MISFEQWFKFIVPGVVSMIVMALIFLSAYPAYWVVKTQLDLRKFLDTPKKQETTISDSSGKIVMHADIRKYIVSPTPETPAGLMVMGGRLVTEEYNKDWLLNNKDFTVNFTESVDKEPTQ